MKTNQPSLQIHFTEICEIRMGSPYNGCNVVIVGDCKIKLPQATWQDKYTWSSDFSILVLVKWDMENNNPGFRFFVIDVNSGKSWESGKIFGLLNNIAIVGDFINFNKFIYDKEKSTQGALCCNVDDQLELWN